MKKHKVYYYINPRGEKPVKKFLDSLSEKAQAKTLRVFQYIEMYGLRSILPHTKKLTGTPLWEIKILGRNNIRVIYVMPRKNFVLVLHGFIKKTKKTPKKELKTAMNRYFIWMKEA